MAVELFSKLLAKVTPKNENYFQEFNALASCTVSGSKALTKLTLVKDETEFKDTFNQICEIESEADGYTRNILLSLHKTFITPFDRREIRELAMALDDIIDFIEEIPQRATIYGRHTFTPEMTALGQITLRATEKVQEAVLMLSDMKNAERILTICHDISLIESEADSIMRAGMRRLFTENSDARELICYKELYDLFEAAVDGCQDVADVIHGVVLERI
jgi:predicted phosphate transport protein (TIGR00153 family)